jgi:hypothetical protein
MNNNDQWDEADWDLSGTAFDVLLVLTVLSSAVAVLWLF